MEPRDAQTLERTRGYSDLDPELVWEQWQVVREKGSAAFADDFLSRRAPKGSPRQCMAAFPKTWVAIAALTGAAAGCGRTPAGAAPDAGTAVPDLSGRWAMFEWEDPVAVDLREKDGVVEGTGCCGGFQNPNFPPYCCGPVFVLESPDSELQALVDDCVANDACLPLCNRVLEISGQSSGMASIENCFYARPYTSPPDAGPGAFGRVSVLYRPPSCQ
jgi:hypothetical protein